MESAEERSSKKKLGAVIGLVLILAGGAWFAYTQGLIPGFGSGAKVAEELKADIEALKGPGFKVKAEAAYMRQTQMAGPEYQKVMKDLFDSVNMDFQYSELKTSSGDGKGTVEVLAPKLSMTSNKGGEPGEIVAQKLIVSRSVNDAKHYFYHTEGDLEFYGDIAGTKTKIFSISADNPQNEIKFGEKPTDGYFKSTATNTKFVEGRGNTILATIGESFVEGSQKTLDDGKIEAVGKLSYKNIVPGDMVKMMVGDIQPLSVNFDYAYKGDNIQNQVTAQPAEEGVPPTMKPFDADIKINDLSIMMGDAGFAGNADLKFTAATSEPVPTGKATIRVLQFQKLIDFGKRFGQIPEEMINQQVAFLSEIGQAENGNLTFNLDIDGANRVFKVNGKTMDEIGAIQAKYFQQQPGEVTGIPEQPAVEATPLPPTDAKVAPGTPADVKASNSPAAPAPAKTETPKTN